MEPKTKLFDTGVLFNFLMAKTESQMELLSQCPIISFNEAVLYELITLIRVRESLFSSVSFAQLILNRSTFRLLTLTEGDRQSAVQILQKYGDKNYSYADCLSLAQATRLGLELLTIDKEMCFYGEAQVTVV